MKGLITLILLIVPTLLFSQESKVWESVTSSGDSIVSMGKLHAKLLARERVEYWFLLEEATEKDSLITSLSTRLGDYENEVQELQSILENVDEQNASQKKLINSYRNDVSFLETELKQEKKRRWRWIIGGGLLGILGFLIN